MSSSLAKQLAGLKEADQTLVKKNDIVQAASLLFHSKVAGAVDLEQVHSLASSAFQRLCVKDELFYKYGESVMGSRVRRVDRNLLTKKENEDLSETLKEFLALLSLYLLEEDAQKIMDFLLRNFNVHHYEAESLIIYFMHFHSTPFYTRLIQNIVLKTREHYGFLHGIISKGEHLRRETVAKQLNHDSHLLVMLIKYNQKVSELCYNKEKSGDIAFSVSRLNQQLKSRVDPSSFLLALLIDLLSVKTKLTETFISSLIETINHFFKRGDVAAISFSLIALGSLIAREKDINHLIIEEFTSFLIAKLGLISQVQSGVQNLKKCTEHIIKFILFSSQRAVITKFTQAQLQKLSQLYTNDESFKNIFERQCRNYSTLHFFTLVYTNLVSGSLIHYQENLKFVEAVVESMSTHDFYFTNSNSEMRELMLSNVVFDTFFFTSGESNMNVEVSQQISHFLKKFFLGDLIKYINKVTENKSEDKTRAELVQTFMKDNFPGSTSFHQNVLLKNDSFYQIGGDKKKGAKDSREYLQSILEMLNEDQETVISSYLDFLVGNLVMKLNKEQNTKSLKLILELICHPAIKKQQQALEDEKRRDHSHLQLVQGYFGFLNIILKQQSGINLKKEIVSTFRSLALRTNSQNSIHNYWVLSSFFVLLQCEYLADVDTAKELCLVIKEYLPNIFSIQQTKKYFPRIDLILSAKDNLIKFLDLLSSLNKENLCLQGIANILSNIFENSETLEMNSNHLKNVIQVAQNIFSDSKSVDFTLLNKQICKFIIRSNSNTDTSKYVVDLLNFILNQPGFDTLSGLKNELVDKIELSECCLLLSKKFMYTSSSSSTTQSSTVDSSVSQLVLQGNIKCLFLINQILKANINEVKPELAYQLFSLVFVRLSTASASEKQGLFLIVENCKKILKRVGNDFDATLLSDALGSGGKRQQITIKYKIMLNLSEIIGKHRVELAVSNPPIGKIIAREVLQQQSNKQRDLQSVIQFMISQVTEYVESEFLVSHMQIIQDILKYSSTQQKHGLPIDDNLSLDLLNKLRHNSFLPNDTQLLNIYGDMITNLTDNSLLNKQYQSLFLDFLGEKITSQQTKSMRKNISSILLSIITPSFFLKLELENQQNSIHFILEKLHLISFEGITDLILQFPFSSQICDWVIEFISSILQTKSGQSSLTARQENKITFILEILLLKEDQSTISELDLHKLFPLLQSNLITYRIKVLVLRVIKKCQTSQIALFKKISYSMKKIHKPSQQDVEQLSNIKEGIVGGKDTQALFIEILKKELNTNLPNEKQIDIYQLEVVKEIADIFCLISSVNFKRISNILFDSLQQLKLQFLNSQLLDANNKTNGGDNNEEVKEESQEVEEKEEQQDIKDVENNLTQAQVLESKVEFVFEMFAFVAKRLLQNCGEERRNKLVKFALIHLEAVFCLLPYFEQQNISILTKIKQLTQVYSGPHNLLPVLFVQATSSLQDPKCSSVILKEMPSIITGLLFESGDQVCCEQLTSYIIFVQGIFAIWTSTYKLQADQTVEQLFTPQNNLIAKQLGLTAKRPNTLKQFIRNSLILLHSIFKSEKFKRILSSKVDQPNSTESVAQIFFTFYYEFVRLDYSLKNALSRAKSLKDGQMISPFAKPLKKLLKTTSVLNNNFINLFEIDVLFTMCALILDNKHSIAYHIRAIILEMMNQQLDAAQNIKKRHNIAIIRVVHTLHEEIAANLNLIYLATNQSAKPKKVEKKDLKKKKQAQNQLSSEQRNVQRYLQCCIVFFTTALDKKPNLFQPENNQIDSSGLLETLAQFIHYQEYSFVMKSSLVFLVASLAAQGNKFRVLPHLKNIATEVLQQALGLLYFNDKDSFDCLITVVSSFTQKNPNQENMLEFIQEVFNPQNLEEKIFNRPQYFKHKESIIKNSDQLFTLVIRAIQNLILSLKNLIQPYLPFIFLSLLSFSQRESLRPALIEFLSQIPSLLESRVIIESLILPLAEICQNISPQAVELYTFLQEKTFNVIDADTLDSFLSEIYKKLFASLDYTRKHFINKEIAPSDVTDAVEESQVKAVSALVVKTNEVQLRKFFLNIVTWSERALPELECGFHFTGYRKIMLFKIVVQLSDTMTTLFTPFFAFIFETQISHLTKFASIYSQPLNSVDSVILNDSINRKRKRDDKTNIGDEQNSAYHLLQVKLIQLNLASLTSCFQNDKDEFIDTSRFQALVDPLVVLFDAFYFNAYSDYSTFVQKSLSPSILSLFQLIKEDYKWKTLNYALMLKTRSENPKIRLAILRTLEKVLDNLGERYMVLINDILPFISETLDDLDQDVERISKSLVIKMEEISGESIRQYFKTK